MFNPWFILGAVLSLFIAFGAGHHQGHKSGANEQKVADQKAIDAANARTQGIIDGYNTQITQQKAEANEIYRKSQGAIIALQVARDALKTRLGAQHVKNQDITNRLRDAYAANGLRFKASESAGCGGSAGGTESAGTNAPGDAAATYIQLPDEITRNLQKLTYDADQLNDDYKLCYGYANPTRAVTDGIP